MISQATMRRVNWGIFMYFFCVINAAPSCMDENGSPVDSFFVIKGPNGNNSWFTSGSTSLKKTAYGMGGAKGAVPYTLAQIYKALPTAHAYVLYNDETDTGSVSQTHAHSKGVVFFDSNQGFWLIHSLPRYPTVRASGYKFLPDSTYGQSFLCVTIPTLQLDNIGTQLQVHWPQIYDFGISNDLSTKYPIFSALLNGAQSSATTSNVTFKTVAGASFRHFAKSKHCDCELYEDIVAASLGADLKVESWMNGPTTDKIPSSCKSDGFKYNVEDIQAIKTSDGTFWNETQDHSKYALTVSSSSATVCVGDINRQYTQSGRGGGALCFKDKSTWTAFNTVVDQASLC